MSAPTHLTSDELRERFERLMRHPDAAQWLAYDATRKTSSVTVTGVAQRVVVALVVLTLLAFVCVASIAAISFLGPLGVVPIVIVLLIAVGATAAAFRGRRESSLPVECFAARVVDESTRVVGEAGAQLVSGNYTTLEFANGSRHSYLTPEPVVTRRAVGDFGIALLRGETLIEFGRVAI